MQSAEPGPEGIAALHMESGERISADLFVDASGFRSELLGRAPGEPFLPYDDTLFHDRALAGGWGPTDERVDPYTTSAPRDRNISLATPRPGGHDQCASWKMPRPQPTPPSLPSPEPTG